MAKALCAGSINPDQSFNREMDAFFMAEARRLKNLGECNWTRVGACIVNSDNKIIGSGYNQMHKKFNYENFPWDNKTEKKSNHKRFYVSHAEVNAIIRTSNDTTNSRIYVTLFPCNVCAQLIIISGIKEVIYERNKPARHPRTIAVKKMFDAAGVEYRQYDTI